MTSYWHASVDRPVLASDELPASGRVAVIGGGVLGASTALWLARAGLEPVLIERAGPAAGATGHNGGLIVSGAADNYVATTERHGAAVAKAVYDISLEGFALMQRLIEEEAISCDFRPAGHVQFALSEAELAYFQQVAAALHADGLSAELLDRPAVQSHIGIPLGEEVVGGKLNPIAAALHSARLVYGLLAAAARYGAKLCWHTELRTMQQDGDGVLLLTSQGVLHVDHVIFALNAWSDTLLPQLTKLITPVRGQVLNTAPLPRIVEGGFGLSLTPTGEYGQQSSDGRLIFGGCRALAPGGEVGLYQPGTTPEVQSGLDAGLKRIFPTLGEPEVERRWSGTMAFTPDYLPIVDAVPDLPGAWFAGGFSGHGMPFASIFGRLLAETVQSQVLPEALAPFRLSRPTLKAISKQ